MNQPQKHLSDYWILYFRHGVQATLHKNFHHAGSLFEAKKRALEHCKIMGYKFIFLRPMVADIEQEEKYKLKGGENEYPLNGE